MVVARVGLSFVLIHVLYIHDWNEANLLSWRRLDMLREFYLLGQDATLEVKFKNAPSISSLRQERRFASFQLCIYRTSFKTKDNSTPATTIDSLTDPEYELR